jgi:hypothetical protein
MVRTGCPWFIQTRTCASLHVMAGTREPPDKKGGLRQVFTLGAETRAVKSAVAPDTAPMSDIGSLKKEAALSSSHVKMPTVLVDFMRPSI